MKKKMLVHIVFHSANIFDKKKREKEEEKTTKTDPACLELFGVSYNKEKKKRNKNKLLIQNVSIRTKLTS